jgi:hypothetical protein
MFCESREERESERAREREEGATRAEASESAAKRQKKLTLEVRLDRRRVARAGVGAYIRVAPQIPGFEGDEEEEEEKKIVSGPLICARRARTRKREKKERRKKTHNPDSSGIPVAHDFGIKPLSLPRRVMSTMSLFLCFCLF